MHIANSKLAVGVSVGGCLTLCPAMNWQRVHVEPPLHPKTSGTESSTPATLSAGAAVTGTGRILITFSKNVWFQPPAKTDALLYVTHDWKRNEHGCVT